MSDTVNVLPERRTARRPGVTVAQALRSTTRAGIFDHLREQGGHRTVRDIARRFDLHPNVARTHLELLADAGLVDVGRRKHPAGGRPAKIYTAKPGAAAAADEATTPAAGDAAPGAGLLVRLLAALVEERPVPAFGRGPSLAARAHEIAGAEGRSLVEHLADREALEQTIMAETPDADRLEFAALLAIAALRPHAPDARITDRGPDSVDVTGVRGMFTLLETMRPSLAEALERGVLAGALSAAGMPVSLADAGGAGRSHALRARAVPVAPPRIVPAPARTVDARGQQREAGVVHALRAVSAVGEGDIVEVLTEGPGSPAAFARWADGAGHQLLGVERATDANGRPAIRLLIRKGSS
ncbi:hypothetical protein BH20ACT8_BH20ACT8_09550 [soil metagenome]